MLTNEKEINCNLFDQLALIERIEITAREINAEPILKQLAFERKLIERKLYQNPSLTKEKEGN